MTTYRMLILLGRALVIVYYAVCVLSGVILVLRPSTWMTSLSLVFLSMICALWMKHKIRSVEQRYSGDLP